MAIAKSVVSMRCMVIFLIMSTLSSIEIFAMETGLSSNPISSAVKAMYVLGDSSVDCGDNSPLYLVQHKTLSLFPCNGSDSTLLPQLLADKMGLPRIVPFYSQNGSIPVILRGVNYGSAEAKIIYPGSQSYQTLNQQLRQAFETIQLLQLHLGEEIANNYVISSLFYLSFGKDDFIDYYLKNSTGISLKYSGHRFSHILVRQMTNAIRNLYSANVRKMIVAGILPLGCAPRVLQSMESSGNGCVDEVNLMVKEYNDRLEEKIVGLNAEFPDFHIVYIDIYRAMLEFINNNTLYGIEDVKNACCGLGKYGGVNGCLTPDMACAQSLTRVWWDLYNPTPAVNVLLAESAWSGKPVSSICRPITIHELI